MAIINNIQECLDFIKNHVETLEKKADETWPKIQKLKPMPKTELGQLSMENAFKVKDYYGGYKDFNTEQQVLDRMQQYREQAKKDKATIMAVHEENVPLIESNEQLREKVRLLMQHIGVPTNYTKSYFKSSRSRTMTRESVAAGWFTDMNRECQTTDGYKAAIDSVDSILRRLEEKCKTICADVRKKEQEVAQEKKRKDGVMALAKMQLKYDLADDAVWPGVAWAIRGKCKYLNLAVAMEETRGDWNDGFYRVENALDNFDVKSEEDKAIEENVSSFLDGETEDGRCFRDCTYNYSVLYGMVDEDIMKDYTVVQQYLED